MPDEQDQHEVHASAAQTLPAVGWARPVAAPVAVGGTPPSVAHPILLVGYPRWAALGEIVLFALLFLGLIVPMELMVGLAVSSDEDLVGLGKWMLPITAYRLVATVGVLALLVRRRPNPAASLGLESRGLGFNVLAGVAALVAAYLLIYPPLLLLLWVVPGLAEQMGSNAERLGDLLPPDMPWTHLLLLMIMVGTCEELIFRSMLMTRLRRLTGSWWVAVVVSTALFAAAHLGDQVPAALLFIAPLSVVLSVVTIWRRSVVPAIVAHALFNFSQMMGMRFLQG
ncbi:MAG TPA: CPBP family intramembrane metalloprotease [Phycisphaerae bacterium]|nr:CPBP family intramembrane metalloprotease [Phycisphaerae bacterium]HNU45221.1 CPBP family intramembrane metalloprotease [Phycisphaerae bacterium]